MRVPRPSLIFLSLLLVVLVVIVVVISVPNKYVVAVNPTFSSVKAYDYIVSNYNSTVGLVRENEVTNKYWLWTDNILASNVLKDYDFAKSANITKTIRDYGKNYKINFRHPVGALFDQVATFKTVTNKKVTGNVWISDSDGTVELSCDDYADIAFLKAIYFYKAGKIDDAKSCYQKGVGFFDGIGFKDKAFGPDGNRYSTYKVAMWQIASNVTSFGQAKDAMIILGYEQNPITGGVYTHYRADMRPDSQTNVETTSLAILAANGMATKPQSPKTAVFDLSSPMFFVAIFVTIGFAVLLFKRFK